MYYNTADNVFRCFESAAWKNCDTTGGSPALSGITAATTDNSINSGAWNQTWNWQLTGAETGFTFGENAASTGGGAQNQFILEASTLAGSTASPLQVTSNSVDAADIVIDLNSAGDFEIQDAGTAFVTFSDAGLTTFNSDVDLTLAGTENLVIGNTTAGAGDVVDLSFTTSNSTDGLDISATGTDDAAADTINGLTIDWTESADTNDIFYAINIANTTSTNSTTYAVNIGTGWDTGLEIADGGTYALRLASTDGDAASGITFGSATPVQVYRSAVGELTIGDGSGNSFVFDTVNGPDYAGTARPTKTITLAPEYAGAILTDFYGAGTDTNITGDMTSDADTTQGTSIRNYYEWDSSETAAQNYYTVAIRITLPKDFSAWATSNALVVNYITESATTTQSDLDVRVYNENSATIVASDLDNSSVTWAQVVIETTNGLDNGDPDWDAADETAVIYLRMGSQDNDFVHVGDIQLNYLAKF
jgi:hypothetical protein